MIRVFKITLVLVLFCLVVMGLNISNKGINELTMQNRGPVLGLNIDIDKKLIKLHLLGETFNYNSDLFPQK